MLAAYLISGRSTSPVKRVGSVIVKNNRILSSGYNGVPSGMAHVSIEIFDTEVNTIHSEQNAIAHAARYGIPIHGATIYITHSPCFNCLKQIIASGITHIKYCEPYDKKFIRMLQKH